MYIYRKNKTKDTPKKKQEQNKRNKTKQNNAWIFLQKNPLNIFIPAGFSFFEASL